MTSQSGVLREKVVDKPKFLGERGREGAGGGADLTFVLRTLILKNNTWTFLGFFFEPANFFMNAAPTT